MRSGWRIPCYLVRTHSMTFSSSSMRTLFIGGTRRGYLTLAALLKSGADIAGVISLRQDDHETERYEEPIRRLAVRCRIPHFETRWMKDRGYPEIGAQEIR